MVRSPAKVCKRFIRCRTGCTNGLWPAGLRRRSGLTRGGFGPLLLFFCLPILVFGAGGCSPRRMLVSEVGDMVHDGEKAYEQETDLYLLSLSFPSHIKLMEVLSASDPQNADLLVLIARLYAGYALAVLETEHEALRYGRSSIAGIGLSPEALARRLSHCFDTGAQVALQALALNHPDARERLKTAAQAAGFFASLDKQDVPALFWYGFNLAGYIQYNLHSLQAVSRAHQVESSMRRVIELDPSFYHFGAHLVLMVYYASRAPMMGGNPQRAQWHYEQHRLAMPQMVRLRELYHARFLLVRGQQRESFTRVMTELAAPVSAAGPLALLDSVAAERAAVYLQAVDHFFD